MSKHDTRLLNLKLSKRKLKFCIGCQKTLKYKFFGKDNSKTNGLTHKCRNCSRKIYKDWYNKSDKPKIKSKKFYHANKRIYKNWDLIRNFGININDFDKMLKKQNYRCKTCRKPERNKNNQGKLKMLSVDHCHKTGKVRGLLCSNCNLGIGNLQDDIKIVKNVLKYLKQNS